MPGDIQIYLFFSGFIVIALILIWVKHKVQAQIIDRAIKQVSFFGKPKSIEYYELVIFLAALSLSIVFSLIEIYPLPWPIISIPFEDDFINATQACGFGEIGQAKLNAWRNGLFFGLIGLLFMLFRVKSYFIECRRRLAMAPKLRTGFLFIFMLGGISFFFYSKVTEYFNPQIICVEEHQKIENILYASAAMNFSILLIYIVVLLYTAQFSLKFKT